MRTRPIERNGDGVRGTADGGEDAWGVSGRWRQREQIEGLGGVRGPEGNVLGARGRERWVRGVGGGHGGRLRGGARGYGCVVANGCDEAEGMARRSRS